MPLGTSLSQFEQGQILGLRDGGWKNKEIANKLHRHRNTISNFLKAPRNYGSIKRSGRKPTIDARSKRHIKRLAVDEGMSSGEIKRHMDLNVTRSRIVQIINENVDVTYTSMIALPELLPRHITARLAFAQKYQFWDTEWQNIVFSDEKKFNLDGPDCSKKYWRQVTQPRRTCHRRVHGGGSVMVWAGFCYGGKTPMCFISTKMNAAMYVDLLDSELIEFAEQIYGDNWTFQQDNAPIHSAKHTKEFFNTRNIPLLDWPAKSPDLNPIEDLWGILSARVFKNGRQFETAKQLKEVIVQEWDNIDSLTLKRLVDSMPARINKLIIARGKQIKY